jgi:hypothetical protein
MAELAARFGGEYKSEQVGLLLKWSPNWAADRVYLAEKVVDRLPDNRSRPHPDRVVHARCRAEIAARIPTGEQVGGISRRAPSRIHVRRSGVVPYTASASRYEFSTFDERDVAVELLHGFAVVERDRPGDVGLPPQPERVVQELPPSSTPLRDAGRRKRFVAGVENAVAQVPRAKPGDGIPTPYDVATTTRASASDRCP